MISKDILQLFAPSWGFFDKTGSLLSTRIIDSEGELHAFPLRISRKPWHVFVNPNGNYFLYFKTLEMDVAMLSQQYAEPAESLLSHPTFRKYLASIRQAAPKAARVQLLIENPTNLNWDLLLQHDLNNSIQGEH